MCRRTHRQHNLSCLNTSRPGNKLHRSAESIDRRPSLMDCHFWGTSVILIEMRRGQEDTRQRARCMQEQDRVAQPEVSFDDHTVAVLKAMAAQSLDHLLVKRWHVCTQPELSLQLALETAAVNKRNNIIVRHVDVLELEGGK